MSEERPFPSVTAEKRADRMKRTAIEGEKARVEYETSAAVVDERTARLRALRLERDREQLEASGPAKPAPVRAARKTVRRNVS